MDHSRRIFWSILLIAAVLRASLALSGGQEFFGDEVRYARGYGLYHAVAAGKWGNLPLYAAQPDHPGFTAVAALTMPVHHALATIGGAGDWRDYRDVQRTLGLAALLLGLSSTLTLVLVHRLARAVGASEPAALWALFLAAATSCLCFYSRHLVPYDVALCAALAGLWLALRSPRWAAQFGSGLCIGAATVIYTGSWFFVPLGAAIVLATRPAGARLAAFRAWALGVGLVIVATLAPGAILGGADYWRDLRSFSDSIRHGEFSEGASLPGRYWWHTEGWFGLVLAAAAAGAAVVARRGDAERRAVLVWAALLGGGYALLVLTSVGTETFVVYGRNARLLAPFVCLLGGLTLARLTAGAPRRTGLLAAGLAGLAAVNFVPHFRVEFPREFGRRVRAAHGALAHQASFADVRREPVLQPIARTDLVLVNVGVLYPLGPFVGYPPGTVLAAAPHPSTLPAYQFEGYTAAQRAELRAHPPEMRLVRLAN